MAEVKATTVVHLKRVNGRVTQGCDVYIGRACYQGGWRLASSKWANPHTVKNCGSAEEACRLYEEYVRGQPSLMAALPELRGQQLGCWCKPGPCHGDVLIKLLAELDAQ